MIWSARPLYAAAMLLAALPALFVARLERAPLAPAVVSYRLGLTLGEDGAHHVVVTSLRSGGVADRDGIKVGDQLTGVAGRSVVALTTARRLVHAPARCALPLMLSRHGVPYRTTIWQCGRSGVG
jgi:predicted metalloprotease with PDZ domain